MQKLLLLILVAIAPACDYFEIHPYDTNISGDTDINRVNISKIEERLLNKCDFKFAVISDTQGWYDETEEFVSALNLRDDIDFVIHCGDLSDFGLKKEFEFQREILSFLNIPYVALIGNHDCIATGEAVYREIFGELNFSFTVGSTRFICLNTNAMEYDYSTPVPDFKFLDRELKALPDYIEQVIYTMHVRPGEFQFNNNVKDIFQEYIKQVPGTPICIYGHEHTLRVDDLFGDGVLYYQCPNIEKRTHLLFTINENGYDYEAVKF